MTPVPELIAVAMAVAVTSFAVGQLALRDGPRRDQAYFLGAFLLLYDLHKLDELGHLLNIYVFAPPVAVLIFPVKMLFAPAIYFYARAMTARAPRPLTVKDGWALAGPALAFLIAAQFFFLTPAQQAFLVGHETGDPALKAWALSVCKLLFFLFAAWSAIWLGAAFRLFFGHVQRLRGLFSNIEDKSLDWLRWVLLVLAAGWAVHAAGEIWALQGDRPAWFRPVAAWVELGWLCVIAFCGVMQRPVFEPVSGERAEPAKYARSALTPERMARIGASLDLAMTRDRLFEDPALSLRALSDRLGVTENHLSQTLSTQFGRNFFDYVNAARIEAARRLLAETDETVLAIAHAVGFNSRSTFNAAFKKHSGTTPSRYRAMASGDSAKGLAAPIS